MFSFSSIALVAVLARASTAARCYPVYITGASYAASAQVSALKTIETMTLRHCVPGISDCPTSGKKAVTTTIVVTYNYECVTNQNSAFCDQMAYAPGSQHSGQAWTEESTPCTGSGATYCLRATITPSNTRATTNTFTYPDAAGVLSVCYTREVTGGTLTMDMTGLKPSTTGTLSIASGSSCATATAQGTMCRRSTGVARTPYVTDTGGTVQASFALSSMGLSEFGTHMGNEGRAVALFFNTVPANNAEPPYRVACGVLVPGAALAAPDTIPKPWTVGSGCPKAFVSGINYAADDLVSVDTGYRMVYKCSSVPNNLFCGMTGYKPGEDQYWEQAWTALGMCSGDMAPTSSPAYTTLQDVGGCPDAYVSSMSYEQGDRVSKIGLVYQCKEWPMGAYCAQQGYEPGTDINTGSLMTDYWKSVWMVIGHCTGSIVPTTAPQFNPTNSVGGCPDSWATNGLYEEGDRVSVTVSKVPIRTMVYQCKVWPYSGFCNSLEPTVFGGDQGWTLVGSCDGSMGPTTSPVFSAVAVSGGCPVNWKASTTTYKSKDRVSLLVSIIPVRKIVYECRVWPNTGYCNQGEGYKPGTANGNIAWTMEGSCIGSMVPTSAPSVYEGDCFYHKAPEQTKMEVNVWDKWANYATGDVVRVGNKRFKCKEWPYFFWCRISTYMPTLENDGIWDQAWTKDGVCLAKFNPTTATPTSAHPSFTPTDSTKPSAHPSSRPSTQPSKQPSSLPSVVLSSQPSTWPSQQPSANPSSTLQPSSRPSIQPSRQPSSLPSTVPSSQPSAWPSQQPSTHPSSWPSTQPSRHPSTQPSRQPSMKSQPSSQPSSLPSVVPSTQPSAWPSQQPSSLPSRVPSSLPSGMPSTLPSMLMVRVEQCQWTECTTDSMSTICEEVPFGGSEREVVGGCGDASSPTAIKRKCCKWVLLPG